MKEFEVAVDLINTSRYYTVREFDVNTEREATQHVWNEVLTDPQKDAVASLEVVGEREVSTILAWTDYPFTALGDVSGEYAPIRQVEVYAYDDNKYCRVVFEGVFEEIKAGYLYQESGRCGEVPCITDKQLATLVTRSWS